MCKLMDHDPNLERAVYNDCSLCSIWWASPQGPVHNVFVFSESHFYLSRERLNKLATGAVAQQLEDLREGRKLRPRVAFSSVFRNLVNKAGEKKFGSIKRVDKRLNYHRERFRELMFPALALRQSE